MQRVSRVRKGKSVLRMIRVSLAPLALVALALAQVPEEFEFTMPDGDVRTYLLWVPEDFDPNVGAPAVFNFHGAGSNPMQQYLYANLTPLAARDGVILVQPNSRSSERPTKSAWHGTLYLPEDSADVDFILALVRYIEEEYTATSFFALGMSSGGDISCAMACQPDSPFSGFGAVTYAYYWGADPRSGGGLPYTGGGIGFELDTPPPSLVTGVPTIEDCAHAQGRRLIYFHGTDDNVCPYDGTGPCWYDPPREETARRWARHNHCQSPGA
eukprot:COSAG02_NODE_408_length_22892_cov_35.212785_20_plen_270_part_00